MNPPDLLSAAQRATMELLLTWPGERKGNRGKRGPGGAFQGPPTWLESS